MILFASDWALYPTAIVDLKTPNKSFIRIAQMFKAMGVKNHAFPLALINPDLQGVDPHSKTLTEVQKALIIVECTINPWYFFREVVRLPPQASTEPVVFLANRGNIALFWSFFCHIYAALIQPRQTGKSASVDCLMIWLLFIGASNTTITLITKDDDLRAENIDRLKSIRDYLPGYIYTKNSKEANNQKEVTCQRLQNHYKALVAQSAASAANNVGRGSTCPVLQNDEGPFCPNIGISLPTALASGTAAREEAAKHNRPYGAIFTTTAGKKDDRDGRFMYDLIHGGTVWSESFYDCRDIEELQQTILVNSRGGAERNKVPLLNITMSHRQLGKTDDWLRRVIAESTGGIDASNRDFLNVWTSGTQRSPLTPALNDMILNSEIDPRHIQYSPERYMMRWYAAGNEEELKTFTENNHIVWGVDTSDAVGRDAIAIVGTNIRDLSVAASASINDTNLIRFANYAVALLVQYPNSTMIIERKSSAATIIDYIILRLTMMGLDPCKRLYNKIVETGRENEDDYREMMRKAEYRPESFYTSRKSKFGFTTNAENRNVLYTNVLQNAAKKAGHLVHDKSLSSEIRSLVEKNERIDHSASGNDDMVIAWLLTHWMLTYSRNLSHYGIDLSQLMCDVSASGNEVSEEEKIEKENQERTMADIEEVLEKLKKSSSEMTTAQLEHRLKVLTSKLSNDITDVGSNVDSLIQIASQERLKNQRIVSKTHQGPQTRELKVRSPFRVFSS